MRVDPLAKASFGVSLVWHIIVILLFFWFEMRLSWKTPQNAFETAIRVDVVGLPDKMLNEPLLPSAATSTPSQESIPPKAPVSQDVSTTERQNPNTKEIYRPDFQLGSQKAAIKEDIVPKPTSAQEERLQKQKRTLKQLEALSRLESNSNAQWALVKGNRVNPGTSLRGIEKIDADNYVATVESHIKRFWQIPPWLKGSYRARVLVKWDSSGNPTLIQIVESSGNDEFDRIVFETIRKASPFPAPPVDIAWKIRQEGILFGFPQ